MASLRKIAAAVYVIEALCHEENESKKRSIWAYDWLRKRPTHGAHQTVLQEYRQVENQKSLFRKFLRMDGTTYDELLELVTPKIQRINTNMREAISPSERLAITLRFLATGDSYASLAVLFRVAPNTISLIIPETCDAIYQVLKNEYMNVCIHIFNSILIELNLTKLKKLLCCRYHQRQINGQPLRINSKKCGIFLTVSVRWMGSTL